MGDLRRGRSFWGSLFPRFSEAISPEFYRLTGKIRAVASVVLVVTNFAAVSQLRRTGADLALWWRHMEFMVPLWSLVIVISLVLWRGRLSMSWMRRLTYLCILIES